ncbi:hypothetical protein ACTWP5_15710 [Streptomyces sp. 4N509B]
MRNASAIGLLRIVPDARNAATMASRRLSAPGVSSVVLGGASDGGVTWLPVRESVMGGGGEAGAPEVWSAA